MESVKLQFFKNELRYYDVMEGFEECNLESDIQITKVKWIDIKIRKLANILLKKYVLNNQQHFGSKQ